MKTIAYVLGVLLIVVAVIYLTVPANSLPSFFPGHEVGLARTRMKHGLAAGVARRHFAGGRLGAGTALVSRFRSSPALAADS